MDDRLDVPLEDTELLDEVELTANLMIAASASATDLSQEEVDRVLGVGIGDRPSVVPEQKRRDLGE